MTFFDDMKTKADINGDGKLTGDDLQHLREEHPDQAGYLSELQAKADSNGDGKVDFSDAKGMADDVLASVKDIFRQK